jgi:hypothetical protein
MPTRSQQERSNGIENVADSDLGSGRTPRTYQLHNRRRPCDQCRARKVRCHADGESPPCQRCAQSRTMCTFQTKSPRTRRPAKLPGPGPVPSPISAPAHEAADANEDANADAGGDLASAASDQRPPARGESVVNEPPFVPPYAWTPSRCEMTGFGGLTPAMQYSQTMEDLPGQTAMLLGTSSEADPWLLRHCQFNEYGLKSFYNMTFRNIGGVPMMEKIPVHFGVTPDSAHNAAAAETMVAETRLLRAQLEQLVPAEWGVRLVRL